MITNSKSVFSQRRADIAQKIRKRLIAHIAAGCTTDMTDSTLENSRLSYTDLSRALQEKEVLFQRTPLVACFSSDIPKAGDHFVFEGAGASVLIIRNQDKQLRAFLNRCSHRGTKLVCTESNSSQFHRKRIVCPFHAWCFDLEGKLVSVPGTEGFEAHKLNQRHLTPIAVTEYLGLVFIQLKGHTKLAKIEEYLGTFHDEVAQLELQKLHKIQNNSLNANTSWKYAMDTYCEGYHFGMLHRNNIGREYFSNIAVFDNFFPHWRLCFAERKLAELVDLDEAHWPEAHFSGIHFIFPNTLLVVGTLSQGEMCVRMFRLFPGEHPYKMTCMITVYAPKSVTDNENRITREFASNDAASEITQEDYHIATEGYRNLVNAPDNFTLIYGKNEPALQTFHRAIEMFMKNHNE